MLNPTGGALAELPQQQGPQGLPPQLDENQDLGPNEVTKKSIGEISLDADNPYDTATPGVLQPTLCPWLRVNFGRSQGCTLM
jgi:hypothetical protein